MMGIVSVTDTETMTIIDIHKKEMGVIEMMIDMVGIQIAMEEMNIIKAEVEAPIGQEAVHLMMMIVILPGIP